MATKPPTSNRSHHLDGSLQICVPWNHVRDAVQALNARAFLQESQCQKSAKQLSLRCSFHDKSMNNMINGQCKPGKKDETVLVS